MAALLAVSMAAAGQGDSLRLMSPHAELTGVYNLDAHASSAWFVQDGPQKATELMTSFALEAPGLQVANRTYVGQVTVTSAGLPVFEVDPKSVEETSSFGDVSVDVIGIHPQAELRLVSVAGVRTAGILEALDVYADATSAPEYDHPYADVYTKDSELARFHQAPHGTALFRTGQAAIDAAGSFELWVRGVDLRVTDVDGRSSEFLTTPTNVPAAYGPAQAESSSWTDFVLTAPAGSLLHLRWASQIDVFTTAASVAGAGQVVFDAAYGVAPGLGGPVELEGESHAYSGVLDAHTSLRVAENKSPVVSWTFASANKERAVESTPLAGAGWSPAWWLVLIVGLSVAAIPAGAWLAARPRPVPPARPIAQDAPTAPKVHTSPYNQGIRLFNEGRVPDALPHLAKGIRDRPKDPEGRYAYGVALARDGRLHDALPHLEFAIRSDPAFLGLLVSDGETKPFRHEPSVAALVRRMARRFHEDEGRGYA